MATEIIFFILVFVFGTIIGSFLNVLTLRYNTGVSPLKGRSFCFSCSKKLGPAELIPIFSFIMQGGKCKGCRSKISWQYPVVEILTGILFTAVFIKYFSLNLQFADLWHILISLVMVAVLVSVTVYDIKHKIIPDGLVFSFGLLAVVNILVDSYLLSSVSELAWSHLVWFLIAGPALALPLFLIWLVSGGRWMGLGDPKLVLGIGWFLGPVFGLSALVLAFWSGALYGLILMFLSRFKWHNLKVNGKTEVPFAPFLILGFLIVFLFNLDILNLVFLIP